MWQPWRVCPELPWRRSSPLSCEGHSEWLLLQPLRICHSGCPSCSIWAATTLCPGSSQPVTEPGSRTRPGHSCQHNWQPPRSDLCARALLGWGKGPQGCTAVGAISHQSSFPFFFHWCQTDIASEDFPCLPLFPLPSTFQRHYLWHLYLCFDVCFLEDTKESYY